MSLDERELAVQRRYRQQNNLDELTGVLGTATGVIPNKDMPGHVWVRVPTSNGLSAPRSVRAPSKYFKMKAGDPVQLEYDKKGRLRIAEPDADGDLARGIDPFAQAQRDESDKFKQTSIQTLAVVADPVQPTLGFCVRSWQPIVGRTGYEFRGVRTYTALGAFALPSAGNMYYVVVFLKADFATLEAFYSTERPITDPSLGLADRQECLDQSSTGSTAIWAQKLVGGQATITQGDLDNDGVPLQQMVNTADGVYRATASTTDATVTTLFTWTVPASTTFVVSVKVTARRTGGSSGTAEDGAYYERVAAIKNVAGVATIIGGVRTPITDIEDQAGWDMTVDVTAATVRVRVTGAASNDVVWVGEFEVHQASS